MRYQTPALPAVPKEYDPVFMRRVIDVLNNLVRALNVKDLSDSVPAGEIYTITNLTTDRTFDADSTSTAELADILGTLITDLETKGIVERAV